MRQPTIDHFSTAVPAPPLRPEVPRWVAAALSRSRAHGPAEGVSALSSDVVTLLTTRVDDVERLGVAELREAAAAAYARLGETLGRLGLSPIRVWNYLPNPTEPLDAGLDRYMVFNEGRNSGYRRWFGNAGDAVIPPTATAVGIQSRELVVHCLASPEPGRPVENPRQTPSWRYSQRYGPTPPRFSRATVASLSNEPVVLIGGTASIVGEDTVHVGDLERQTHETLRNLAALIAAASVHDDEGRALHQLRSLRVYVRAPQHADEVRGILATRCPQLSDLEFATSALCRTELLVEIEGVAGLTRRA